MFFSPRMQKWCNLVTYFFRPLFLNSMTFPGLSSNFRIPGLFQACNFSFQIPGLFQDSRTCGNPGNMKKVREKKEANKQNKKPLGSHHVHRLMMGFKWSGIPQNPFLTRYNNSGLLQAVKCYAPKRVGFPTMPNTLTLGN